MWTNVSDDTFALPLTNFAGSEVSDVLWSAVAQKYLKIRVNSQSSSWELKVMTDNFLVLPDTTIWGTQYGGLIQPSPPHRVAMGWQTRASVISGGPTGGDPGNPSSGWLFVKDRQDADILAASGYITIAYGAPGYTNIHNFA